MTIPDSLFELLRRALYMFKGAAEAQQEGCPATSKEPSGYPQRFFTLHPSLFTYTMSYEQQRDEWLRKHPRATPEEIWTAGYLQSLRNWCNKTR